MTDHEIKEIERESEREERVEQIVDKLFDELNVMGIGERITELLFNSITRKHRTLQATFIRVISAFLRKYGEQENFDLRNEAAVTWAKKVSLEDAYIPFI